MTARRPSRSIVVTGLVVAALVTILVGTSLVGASVSDDLADPGSTTAPAAGDTAALAVLATLPVKGRAPKTGYDREGSFGSAWQDVDQNGCDTRNDILTRDLTVVIINGGCEVQSGTLLGPFTGLTIDFVRGQETSSLVQIDHLVSLSNAWQTGAQQLSAEQRAALANDPLNLLAVDGVTNSRKGDGDAATWLPPLKSYRCAYVARQISVKAAYALWVTSAEHDAMTRILSHCTEEIVMSTPEPVDTPGDVYFQNCTAARAAGAAPVHAGDPGYGSHLDRDGNGTGCE